MAQPTTHDRIRKTPGVCGGDACVRETRIPVWLLHRFRTLGRTDAQLLEDYPTLTADDLRAAWDYARDNPGEIAAAAARQRGSAAEKV